MILFADRKNPSNKNLFVFALILCLWVLNELLQWLVKYPQLNLFFVRISILAVIGLPFFLFFTYYFSGKEINWKKKTIFLFPLLPVFVFLFTDFNAYITNESSCDVDTGSLYFYICLICVFYVFFSIRNLFVFLRGNDVDKKIKNQAKLISIAVFVVVTWIAVFAVLWGIADKNSYKWIDTLSLFAPLGLLVFVSIVAYAITKYKLLNIKLMAVQVLVAVLVVLIGSQLFFVQNPVNRILTFMTLALAVGFGYMLIRSVASEVKRREELQIMSDRLAQANDQLRKLDNAKSEFISIASHQLRTPLTAIKGFISLLLEGSYGKVASGVKDVLNKVYLSNERLIALVEDMLNLSRIESGRMEYNFEKVKMEDVAREVYDTFVIRSKEKGLKLELKLPENLLPEAMTDKNKIREVISNLVDNAIKYTLKGWVVLKLSLSNDNILISVVDTGIGIPKEEIPYLFNKFSRGKDISRLNTGGTGLGLHVGKRMVDALHGHLWVESEGAGKGSTFNVEIPLKIKEEK